MNWASKQDDSLVVHYSKSLRTQKNQVNKGLESSESMATIAVDSVTERKKMGMEGRNIYVTDETNVVGAELANNLLDDRRGTFFWKLTWKVTCGCAAGVAAAFRAPVGGVLFALEEVTSWWRSQLMWRVFFTSAIVAVVVRTAMGWCKSGKCGHFGSGGFIIWDISDGQEDYSFEELLPMAIIGVIGGLLGALFNQLTLYMTSWRRNYLHKKGTRVKIIEACLISVITSVISFGLPLLRKCSTCPESDPDSGIECPRPPGMYGNYVNVRQSLKYLAAFYCGKDNEYNDLATIFFNTQDDAIRNLFSAKTIHEFSAQSLEILEDYSAELKGLSMKILRLMAQNLRMEETEMAEFFEEGWQSMRMNYYPPCPQPELAVGLCPHSDGAGITILLQIGEVEGLQIRKDGMWIPVKPLPNAFVINIGDSLEIVSNGTYRSIEHRATVNSLKERLSVATAYSPNLDGEIGPAPSLLTLKTPAMFRRIGVKEYYEGRFSNKLDGKSTLDTMRIQNEMNKRNNN
ncbi:hypothetical protein JRO89_XS06G0028200 [Xanthoceras sorbifolium]|uniref:Fe2OG dioxygenase domain-containing protein n=1 Tax=Xanthoceras sorbifolium TaxID=99658 RepID=A0ABQ8HWF0_9ROSI|nr:hypothetical protein JRO89_XS06G0028200 [Xanthoceras sorbifolium]